MGLPIWVVSGRWVAKCIHFAAMTLLWCWLAS